MSHSCRATPLSIGVVVLGFLGVWHYVWGSCLRSSVSANLGSVLRCIPLWNPLRSDLGVFDRICPPVYRFPEAEARLFLFFGWDDVVGTGCSLIGNFSLSFLGSFATLAPSQQFSVLCIFPHVSHLGLVLQFGLSQRCPFLLRNSVLSAVGNTVPCRGHICHSGNNNLSVAVSFCLPSLRRPLCWVGLGSFCQARLVRLIASLVRGLGLCRCRVCLLGMPCWGSFYVIRHFCVYGFVDKHLRFRTERFFGSFLQSV